MQPLLDKAQDLFPQATPTYIELPRELGDSFVVRFRQQTEKHPNGRTFVFIDPASNTILFQDDATNTTIATSIINMIYPLHKGEYGGAVYKVVLMLTGGTLTMMVITGFWFWWRREKVKFKKRLLARQQS